MIHANHYLVTFHYPVKPRHDGVVRGATQFTVCGSPKTNLLCRVDGECVLLRDMEPENSSITTVINTERNSVVVTNPRSDNAGVVDADFIGSFPDNTVYYVEEIDFIGVAAEYRLGRGAHSDTRWLGLSESAYAPDSEQGRLIGLARETFGVDR